MHTLRGRDHGNQRDNTRSHLSTHQELRRMLHSPALVPNLPYPVPSMAEPTALESLWPPLAKFLDVIFCPQGLDRARMSVFSHEELYRSVYTICLRGNRHDLLDRLLSFAEIAFAQTERDINAAFEENGVNSGGLGEGGIGEVAGKWLTRFGRALTDATKATESAIHVFAYLVSSFENTVGI
ncbi:hypothetical protein M427DRAFT_430194 [Gonapodya prolifera JEL478]|uniref:Cullin N-terminal domain-containing protein n=1 Tax=Gonapodya prolifera (strain JEL478) TaxID=1344416 RepID=A0A139ATH4_GONPJ|nr:hypothetical protein M427DRAFT_430194 [Gonapodya prolifera JEL478]|eukprot:KXS19795.1 hypothetical protein M427DRAFT_430194 [Gonapodya prolifera JEL478]